MTRVVVLGDALLDRDIVGSATRMCPDAPAPVVDEGSTVDRPGGAALAAVLAAERADVTLVCGLVEDDAGATLRRLVERRGVAVMPVAADGATAEKIRVRVGGQSLLRLDRGGSTPYGSLGADPRRALAAADAVLVADYGGGLTGVNQIRSTFSSSLRDGTPVVWDPHPRGSDPIENVTVVLPNEAEAAHFDGPVRRRGSVGDLTEIVAVARRLRERWSAGAVALTRGDRGVLLVTGSGAPLAVPVAPAVGTPDTCGAGDAFAAAVAVALGDGAVLSEAVESAVATAASFVHGGGAGAISGERPPRRAGGSIPPRQVVVATGGCFDILHPGHIQTLTLARQLGDRLVVLLNSDESVRRLKGPGRPLQRADDRAAVLRSLSCVDDVVVFDDDTPREALRRLRPNVFVKGGDYTGGDLPERDVMRAWGGTVVTVPFLAGRSTSRIAAQLAVTRGVADVE